MVWLGLAGALLFGASAQAASSVSCPTSRPMSFERTTLVPATPWSSGMSTNTVVEASGESADGPEEFSASLTFYGTNVNAFDVTPNGTVAAPSLSLQGSVGTPLLAQFTLSNLGGDAGDYELESYRTLQSGAIDGESTGLPVRAGQLIVDTNGNGVPEPSERVGNAAPTVSVPYDAEVLVWVELSAPPVGQTELVTLAAQAECQGYGNFYRSVGSLVNDGSLDRDNVASYTGVDGGLAVGTSADRLLREPSDAVQVTDFVAGLSATPVVGVQIQGARRGVVSGGSAADLASLGAELRVWPLNDPSDITSVDAAGLEGWVQARLSAAVSAGDPEFRWVLQASALPNWVAGSQVNVTVDVDDRKVTHRFWNGSVAVTVEKSIGACPAGPMSCGPQLPLAPGSAAVRPGQAAMMNTLACNTSGLDTLRIPLLTETLSPGFEVSRLAMRAEDGSGLPVAGQALYGSRLDALSTGAPTLLPGEKTILAAWDSDSDGVFTALDRLYAGQCLHLRLAGAFESPVPGPVSPLISPELF